jgi:hypothetical protein
MKSMYPYFTITKDYKYCVQGPIGTSHVTEREYDGLKHNKMHVNNIFPLIYHCRFGSKTANHHIPTGSEDQCR